MRRQALLMHNTEVYLALRAERKTTKAIEELKLDLSGLESVRAVEEFFGYYVLVNEYKTEQTLRKPVRTPKSSSILTT